MRATGALCMALAEQTAIWRGQNTTYMRVGRGECQTLAGQVLCLPQKVISVQNAPPVAYYF
jgi:hypothetical protein